MKILPLYKGRTLPGSGKYDTITKESEKQNMKKTFNFGKVAYTGKRKINTVEVTVELKENKEGKPCFTASGMIWNAKHTDAVSGGQNLDEINKFVHTQEFKEIYELWQKYHLNDMHAGTVEQEKAVNEYFQNNTEIKYDYDKACEHLKELGIYEVEHEGKPYKYGCGWVYYSIPEEDLTKIKNLLN